MKLDTQNYVTADEAAALLGCGKRTLWRSIDRAGRAEVTETVFGRLLIKRSKLPLIEKYYFRRGTDRAHQAAVDFGRRGGTQKHLNALQRGGGSGKADTGDAG